MLIDSKHMVSVTDMSRKTSRYVSEVQEGQTYVVMKQNQPAAVLTSTDRLDRLNQLEELERDLRLTTVVLIRMATDDGTRRDLADVAAEFGVDLDED